MVCSLTAEEGDGVAEAFEAECPDFTREADLFLGPWDGELDAYRVFRWRLG